MVVTQKIQTNRRKNQFFLDICWFWNLVPLEKYFTNLQSLNVKHRAVLAILKKNLLFLNWEILERSQQNYDSILPTVSFLGDAYSQTCKFIRIHLSP